MIKICRAIASLTLAVAALLVPAAVASADDHPVTPPPATSQTPTPMTTQDDLGWG